MHWKICPKCIPRSDSRVSIIQEFDRSYRVIKLRRVCDACGFSEVADKVTYFVQAATGGPVKIGRTTKLKQRFADLKAGSPTDLQIVLVLFGDFENEWHRRFSSARMHGEWFRPDEDLLDAIRESGGNPILEVDSLSIEQMGDSADFSSLLCG